MSQVSSVEKIGILAVLRFKLLIRQKLGWISIVAGCALVGISFLIATVSFVNAQKIFWDFALGVIFLLQTGLAIYLGTQLYSDEKSRRTLHLLLSGGVSRLQWLVGNQLGIFCALLTMQILWFVVTLLSSYLAFGQVYFLIALQALVLLNIEVAIILSLGTLFSFFLRSMLALTATLACVFLLHSLTSVQKIFTDPQVGRFIDDSGSSWVLVAARFLPPLEWLDLKSFVGYEPFISWGAFAGIAITGLCWALLLTLVGWLRFERMDL